METIILALAFVTAVTILFVVSCVLGVGMLYVTLRHSRGDPPPTVKLAPVRSPSEPPTPVPPGPPPPTSIKRSATPREYWEPPPAAATPRELDARESDHTILIQRKPKPSEPREAGPMSIMLISDLTNPPAPPRTSTPEVQDEDDSEDATVHDTPVLTESEEAEGTLNEAEWETPPGRRR